MQGVLVAIAVCAGWFVYFLPTIVARSQKHYQANKIAIINTLLGWTVVGWIVALIWAFTTTTPNQNRM